ncbi:MAG: hypothetical protein AABZ47_02875, partial [Planctomycetota bacterium]
MMHRANDHGLRPTPPDFRTKCTSIHDEVSWLIKDILILIAFCSVTYELRAQASDEAAPPPTQPVDVQSSLDAATKLLIENRPRELLEAFTPIAAAEPNNPWLSFYRGWAYAQLGDCHRAVASFDESLAQLAALGDPDAELAKRIRLERRRAQR